MWTRTQRTIRCYPRFMALTAVLCCGADLLLVFVCLCVAVCVCVCMILSVNSIQEQVRYSAYTTSVLEAISTDYAADETAWKREEAEARAANRAVERAARREVAEWRRER